MPARDEYVVRSDEDAWAILERMLALDPKSEDDLSVRFEGWPSFDVTSKKGHAEIDTSTMKGYLAYQGAIWRTFQTYHSNTRDLRTLLDEDRERLVLAVKVEEGSSGFELKLDKTIADLAKALFGKMTPRDWIIVAVSAGLIFAGQDVWKAHIAENAKIRIASIDSEERRQTLETFAVLSQEETRRMEVLAEALRTVPAARIADSEGEAARQEYLKNVPQGYSISIEGIDIPPDVLSEIIKPERQYSEDVVVTGLYYIDSAKTTDAGFHVILRDAKTDQSVSGRFGELLKSASQRSLVQRAFFDKTPVVLTLDARQRGDTIISAEIIGAKRPPKPKTKS